MANVCGMREAVSFSICVTKCYVLSEHDSYMSFWVTCRCVVCVVLFVTSVVLTVLLVQFMQTYTGRILIAVNPFAKLSHMYNMHMMEQYRGVQFGELSPHVFAIADASYKYEICKPAYSILEIIIWSVM